MSGNLATTDGLAALKDEFLATLNHEIRTPLSGILGMVELLFETELKPDQREYLDAVQVCAEHLLQIMNSTLEYSALSADQVVLEESEFPLRAMLDGALNEFSLKAKARGLELVRHWAADLPQTVIGDAVRLRQLIHHVVANAIKFTHQGEVEVRALSVTLPDREILLSLVVRDTGVGIPADKLVHIFQSFRQLETGLARRYTGIGLGLAVTQKLAMLMRGDISVRSEVGKGTEFTIHIPLKTARESTALAPPGGKPQRVFRILVVEDDSISRSVTVHVLHRRAYQVDCVADGAAAIEAVARSQYDLILMDLQLPGMDGLETAAGIRRLRGSSAPPILALTANSSLEGRELCRQQGMRAFLRKPVQSKELLRAVEAFLPGPTSIAV